MSRQQVERGVDAAETFAVDQPILAFSGGALALVKKLSKILARCLAISWLMSAADDDVQTSPTPLANIVAPAPEKCVQLLELDAHRQVRSLERVRGECPDMFLESVEIHHTLSENSVDERTRAAQQLGRRRRWDGYRW